MERDVAWSKIDGSTSIGRVEIWKYQWYIYIYMYLRLHTYYVYIYIYICSPVGMIFFFVKTKIERRCLEFSSLEWDIFQMTNLAGHF